MKTFNKGDLVKIWYPALTPIIYHYCLLIKLSTRFQPHSNENVWEVMTKPKGVLQTLNLALDGYVIEVIPKGSLEYVLNYPN